MPFSTIVSFLIAPAIFWISYFYYKDRFYPEPIAKILMTYLLGFGCGYLCFHFYRLLPVIGIPGDPSGLAAGSQPLFFLYLIGVVGVVEELFKFLPFIFLVRHFSDFDEGIDGIIYASIIALGFATFENIYYLPLSHGWKLVGRSLASPLTHTIFSSIWGYWIARAYLSGKSRLPAAGGGLLLAAIFHGLFDYLTLNPSFRVFSAFLILMIWIWRIVTLEKHNRDGVAGGKQRGGGEA